MNQVARFDNFNDGGKGEESNVWKCVILMNFTIKASAVAKDFIIL